LRLKIDITDCKSKEEQITRIFEELMDKKLIVEARIYSIVFTYLNETKSAPNLTYTDMQKAFLAMKELPPTEIEFSKALKNLMNVEIKFMDGKQRRSVALIKGVI